MPVICAFAQPSFAVPYDKYNPFRLAWPITDGQMSSYDGVFSYAPGKET